MKSLKENLLSLLRAKGTLSYADAVSYSMSEGYKIDNMSRRMRELCHEQPIVPITAISKRNTEYIIGWTWKDPFINWKGKEGLHKPTEHMKAFVLTSENIKNVLESLPPAFAPRTEEKQEKLL